MALPVIIAGAAGAVKTYRVFRKTSLGKTIEGSVIAAIGAVTEHRDKQDGTDPTSSTKVKNKGVQQVGEGVIGMGIERYQNRNRGQQ